MLRKPSATQQQAIQGRIVLRAVERHRNTQIASELAVSLPTVALGRRKFGERRLESLVDAPRLGRPRRTDDAEVQRMLAKTLEPPPDGAMQWSVRRLAALADETRQSALEITTG